MEGHLQAIRSQLPGLLAKLARIPDPRRPRSVRHKLTVVLVYGILLFLLQFISRRAGNQSLSRPAPREMLRAVFPDMDSDDVPQWTRWIACCGVSHRSCWRSR